MGCPFSSSSGVDTTGGGVSVAGVVSAGLAGSSSGGGLPASINF